MIGKTLSYLIHDLYLSTQPKPWKLKKPTVIQFPVNDICNAKCQMCNIWQQKFDYQITPLELEKAISNPLFSEVRGIGINGGEPTLRKDLAEIVNILFIKLPRLSGISLITNSLNSSQVIERITEIGQVIKSHSGYLDVMVSIDGVGEVHDRVRGRKGNFDNAVKVIDFIKNSKLVSNTRLGCTIIKDNVYGLHDLLEFALDKNIYIKYRLGIPHQRLYSKEVIDPFSLTFEEKYHIAIFLENLIRYYEKSEQQKFFYKSLLGQLIYQKPRTAGCDWQYRGVTLSARGELLYCAVESKTLGSAISENSEQLYFNNREHLADIVKNKCSSCAHDYVGLPPTKVLLKNYTKRFLGKFGIYFQPVRELAVLKTVAYINQQLAFGKRMTFYGVNRATLDQPLPARTFPKPSTEKRKVLICGWYGTETLGDKAILGGVVQALQTALGSVELHLASLEIYVSEMTVRQMPELKDCKLHSVTNAVKITNSMDLVVFGGGPLMAIANVAEMLAIFQKATATGVPTLIAGCGIGPLGASFYNDAIKSLLQHASHRIYRDRKSLETAQTLGIDTSQDRVAEDPALTWLESCLAIDKKVSPPSKMTEQPILLLGLRDWSYHEYARQLNKVEGERIKLQFEQEVITALKKLLSQYPHLKIIPFPMCTNHLGNDDRWFYRRLFKNYSRIYEALDLTYLGVEIDPLEAVRIFKSASVALTMRFHSLVFALSAGVPAIAIDYTLGTGKVASLAQKYNIPCMSLDALSADFLITSVSAVLDGNRDNSAFVVSNLPLIFTHAVNQFVSSLEKRSHLGKVD